MQGVAAVEERPFAPFRWTNDKYLALVEAGIVPEARGIELHDGQVIVEMPHGERHRFAFVALQKVFDALNASALGLEIGTSIDLPGDSVYDPEFAFIKPRPDVGHALPKGSDVSWVIEVADSSRNYDLSEKARIYAVAGIPEYWVVDIPGRGIWRLAKPANGEYRERVFLAEGESPIMPVVEAPLAISSILPPVS